MARGLAAIMALMLALASSSVFGCGSKVKDSTKDGSGQPATAQPKI